MPLFSQMLREGGRRRAILAMASPNSGDLALTKSVAQVGGGG